MSTILSKANNIINRWWYRMSYSLMNRMVLFIAHNLEVVVRTQIA